MQPDQHRFNQGQKVRHTLSHQVLIFDFYEMQTVGGDQKPGDPFWEGSNQSTPLNQALTGRVSCSWIDENNFSQRAYFPEHEIEPVE